VTSRRDIEPDAEGWRRLSYTCRCGWVDWGHALPKGPNQLALQIDREASTWPGLGQLNVQLEGAPAYIIDYGQAMGLGPAVVSASRHWVVRKGLTLAQRRSVALAICLSASVEFETLQGRFPFSIVSGRSSFSPEDLISNVIGFYAAFDSVPLARMRQICGEVTVEECHRIWDTHLPGGLNALAYRGLEPTRFPCPECDGSQSDLGFPVRLSSIQPAPQGVLWVPVRGRFIDGRIANARQAIDVSSRGEVSVRRAR
jgi:hypothetical protein